MNQPPLRILVIGAGRFGRQHLAEWIRLSGAGEVELVGVVVTSEHTSAQVQRDFGVPAWSTLTDDLLRSVDAVDIVTPPATHASLIRRCLPFAHVLVEKPIATEETEAADLSALAMTLGRVLMVGHLFRFHPVVEELKRLVAAIPERPRGIQGTLINPEDEAIGRDETNLEMLHLFDIIDFLFDVEPTVVEGRRRGRLHHISLRYPGPMNALLRIGWTGRQKLRHLHLFYSDRRCSADLIDNSIVVSTRNNQLHKSFFPGAPQALRNEFLAFIAAIRQPAHVYPDATVGTRIVRIAHTARPQPATRRPRVAVIGGGIFGAACALELADVGDVTIFERHADLLTETSATNQRRHHSGFHYPRSYDTILEIRAARDAFEAEFGEAIDRSIPAYYCTSATGVEIPAERYVAACQSNHLAFTIVQPPGDVVDPSAVSVCVKTDEAVYDVVRLRRLVSERLARTRGVSCRTRTSVASGVIASDGSKRLTAIGPDGTHDESFDYVVNATYASRNLVAQWFGFPTEPLRFDLYELLVVRLPIPQICVTVLDGPFTSLTGTGQDHEFMLSHIHHSVSRSVIPDDGMPPTWSGLVSNRENMLRHSSRYLPILQKATDVRSCWLTRAVNAFARDFDARPTVITDHGFGCWSVLGGKVITSVSNAREIALEIRAEQGGAVAARPSPGRA